MAEILYWQLTNDAIIIHNFKCRICMRAITGGGGVGLVTRCVWDSLVTSRLNEGGFTKAERQTYYLCVIKPSAATICTIEQGSLCATYSPSPSSTLRASPPSHLHVAPSPCCTHYYKTGLWSSHLSRLPLDPGPMEAFILCPMASRAGGECRGLLFQLEPPTGIKDSSLVPVGGSNRDKKTQSFSPGWYHHQGSKGSLQVSTKWMRLV